MGFFDKIFGGGQAQAAAPGTKLRAEFKDASFFKMMIGNKRSMIKMYQEDNEMLKQEGKFTPVNNWMIAMEHLDLV
ncbi:hypothetical protein [Mucilaginibacter sp.]|jgi:hypothetical protein|uniref:hypothetical protein n=1 Tax=Mucilaginibacter sp. TaxID=1882438 RepID=UPI003568DD13